MMLWDEKVLAISIVHKCLHFKYLVYISGSWLTLALGFQ